MSTAHHQLSSYDPAALPSAASFRFAVITAEWNTEITAALKDGAISALKNCGAKDENIYITDVPGSFELTAAAALLAAQQSYDAIICLGCVVQGETRHFEFICNGVANGLSSVSVTYKVPVIFGVLTTDTLTQAVDRAGGDHGNKGIEAAVTAVKMAALKKSLS
jgi:6,7-dimethyl-8-ribityllumazine synthase